MYNEVLELKIPEEASIIGFADDIAIVVRARFLDEVELYANETIRTVKAWLVKVGLELADQKTEVVLISNRRKKEAINIQVGRLKIKSSASIKYLGMMIDEKLNYKDHMEYACRKAAAVNNALCRIMPNVGGPRRSRRVLISKVTTSVLLYASPIWAENIGSSSRKNVLSIFRQSCLRICSGYRTISLDAVCVVAGMIPVDMAAEEAYRVYIARESNTGENLRVIKLAERRQTMLNWQRSWENSVKGRWTYRLIPKISLWIERKHGEVNYELTQFLTGHGGYRSYLHKFGHDDSSDCPTCLVIEDVEHVVFVCPRFNELRCKIEADVGCTLNTDNVVDVMLTSEGNWQKISDFITTLNKSLRCEEQRRKEQRAMIANTVVA